MLILDELEPKFLDNYKINKNIAKKLSNIIKFGIDNILLYGNNGVGKYTLLKSLLNEYFKEEIKTSIVKLKINVASNTKIVDIHASTYHYEIIIDKYFNSKKMLYYNLLRELTVNGNINVDENNEDLKKKIIIIKNIEFANNEFICLIKNIIEKKYNIIKFFITTNNTNKLKTLIPFINNIRVSQPNNVVVKNTIKDYLSKKNITLSKKKIDDIFHNSINLKKIFVKLECLILNVKYKDELKDEIMKIIKLIEKKDIKNILKIRVILYDLITKNINSQEIYKILLDYFCKSNYNFDKKNTIINLIIENNRSNNKSYKNIIYIEALLINILNIL